MKSLFVAIFASILILPACKKTSTPDPVETVNPTKALISKKWKQISALQTYDYQPGSFEEFTTRPLCDRDNITTYVISGTYSVNGGAVKCTPTEADVIENGTWELLNNDTQFKITSGSYTNTGDIVKIISDTFAIKYTQNFSFGKIFTTVKMIPAP